MSVAQDADGWTVITPESDSHVIYVSNSQGSDNNSGRSPEKPVKSVAKGISLLRDGSPDQMLLKRGDVWTDQAIGGWWKSGRSEQAPLVIGAYGTGARPRLDTGSQTALNAGSSPNRHIDHVAIMGIHFSAHTRLPGGNFKGADGGDAGIRLLAPTDDFLIEDCYLEGYQNNILLQDFFGPLTDVRIRRSTIVDAWSANTHAQGLYAEGVNGLLLEENIFDHNGWLEGAPGGHATGFNHNVYLRADNENVVVRGNVFARAGSHGLQARAGGVIENNLFLDNPIGMSFGLVNGSPATAGGVSGVVNGNVFAGGNDAKIGNSMRGWALEIGNTKPGGGTVVSNNLFAGDPAGAGAFPAMVLAVGSNIDNVAESVGINDLTIRGNVVYRWAEGLRLSSNLKPGGSGPDSLKGVAVRDNDFQRLGSEAVLHDMPFDGKHEQWSGNRYDGGSDGRPDITVGFNVVSWDRWKADREPTAKATKVKYASPDRTAGTYNASLGGEAAPEALLAEMRKSSGQNRRAQYTAKAAIDYMRAGFAEGGSSLVGGGNNNDGGTGQTPGQPSGGNGNGGDNGTPGTPAVNPEPVPVPRDWSAPTAPLASASMPADAQLVAGDAILTFTVTYTAPDGSPIDLASLDAGDVHVTGPRKFDQPASLVSAQPSADGTTVVATYGVAPAGRAWERGDKGAYAIALNADQVCNARGSAVEAGDLAEFKLTVAKPPPPDKAPTVKKLKLSPKGASSVTVFFSEDVSSSLDAGDLFLVGEDNARAIDPGLMALSYDPDRNAATWTFPGLADGTLPKGKFRVVLPGWAISDSAGQKLQGGKGGDIGEDYAPQKWFKV